MLHLLLPLLLSGLLASCHGVPVPVKPGETGDSDTAQEPDTSDTSDSDPPLVVEGFTLSVDEVVRTLVHASWEGPVASEAWVEYRFEEGDWRVAPTIEPSRAVLLGIPANIPVTARAVLMVEGETLRSEALTLTTGSLPADLLSPTVSAWDPSLAWEAPYAMIVVACGSNTFSPPYWIEIFDRLGRVVWYQEVPDNMLSFSPSIARDGTHLWFEGADVFGTGWSDPFVTRMTLDGRWSETLEVPDLGQAIAEGPEGAFFFETRGRSTQALSRLEADGSTSTVWDCHEYFRSLGLSGEYCSMNACNWDEARDTVLVSQFYTDTVFEIDVATGTPLRQMGQLTRGSPYAFDPSESIFDYQHNPSWLASGTLLVSTHVRGRYGIQVAAEYEVDDATRTVRRVWSYQSSDLWATQLGEALRLPNGNTLLGYGQDGAVREITPEGEVAWQVAWSEDRSGYRVLGHLSFIEDLYALNQGPE